MIQVSADLNPILRRLTKLGGQLSNPADFLQDVGAYFEKRIDEGFRQEKDPYGKKWKPLSPATISEKERLGFPLKILTRRGKMRSEVKTSVSGKTVRITVPFPAQFHQIGTKRMPQRQILPDGRLSKTDERNIVDLAIEFLDI
ncbi:phage virion morphogenesis protein [Aulosira sp. FACHB-615]|uniref:phage virion morphogenesis protein n=1 Tax=Aulosira sp. FACHB-615 TaxID=2692777 RepID=UPI001684BDA8|nr:phage virion morphogenesis protein [Aulosira sp. FACHB-615]MBD2492529.1 phage virion morphogenesis protein [Aulosira sp. FACHB-615]